MIIKAIFDLVSAYILTAGFVCAIMTIVAALVRHTTSETLINEFMTQIIKGIGDILG